MNSLIVPIVDTEYKDLVALYYLKYEDGLINTYILLNDQDDIAYNDTKYLINFFEKNLGLSISNQEIELSINSAESVNSNKLKISISSDLVCYHWTQIVSFAGYSSEQLLSECNIETSFDFNNHSNNGSWGNNSGGNYPPNGSYGGGSSGNKNNKPDPVSDPDWTPEPLPEVVIDPSWVGTKADCAYRKLKEGGRNSILNKLLKGFELDKSAIDLTFYVGNTDYNGNTVKNGKCIFVRKTRKISIYISNNRLIKSSLEIARTILHESLHAYMYGKLHEVAIHNGLAPEPNFAKDFANYTEVYGKGRSNSAQHNYMANMYVSYMKEGLESFFYADSQYIEYASNNSSNEYWNLDSMLEGLAWQGLHKTDTYKDFRTNNTERVNDFNRQISLFVNDYKFPKNCD